MLSNLNVDIIIFVTFLIANLCLGLFSSRGIVSIKEYAIGNRNFSTATIVATLVATWISGEFFYTALTETYSNGLYFAWVASAGNVVSFLSVGLFFAPRLIEFMGKLSIAEAMGDLFGKKVRIITSLCGFIGVAGVVAIQLKVSGMLFSYCFGIPDFYGIIIGGAIITFYSSLGGIKSVTFTDVIQFFTFGTIIPIVTLLVLEAIDDTGTIVSTLKTHPLFDYNQVFDLTQAKSLEYFMLFIYWAMPAFDPAIFQRIAMAANFRQVGRSFTISGFACLFIGLTVMWLAVLLLANKPGLNANDILNHLLSDYSIIGLKGLILTGIMAMVMSTADSYINSTSILVIHDFWLPLGIKVKNELFVTRAASVAIGIFAICLAMREGSLMKMLIFSNLFYMPVVTVPFIMVLLGFRSSGKSVLIGMGGGAAVVAIWEIWFKTTIIGGLIPGMAANLICLVGSHYLLRQPGGWVGIRDKSGLNEAGYERKLWLHKLIEAITNFNLNKICKRNGPKSEGMTIYLGIFSIISIYSTMHIIPKEIELQHPDITRFIYSSVLLMATGLLSYPLWLQSWKESNAINVYWNVCIFYILICSSFMLVLVSSFSAAPLMAFIVNLIVVAALLRWQWAICMMVIGIWLTISIFKWNSDIDSIDMNVGYEFKVTYILLSVSSILVMFFKPKQEDNELTIEKVGHLAERINDYRDELYKATELKYEFLRNLQHESHAPITGITSLAQIIDEAYDKLSEKERRKAIHDIAMSTERLESYVGNIIDLSKLASMKYSFDISPTDISYLVMDKLERCRKFYLSKSQSENIEFVLNIEPNLVISCDLYYIGRTIENIIINAMQYCKKGKIEIELTKTRCGLEFSVRDEGMGIPQQDLKDIFGAFTVSSKTKTPAGGRGVGLALAKKVVDLHKGTITVESDGTSWTKVFFIL